MCVLRVDGSDFQPEEFLRGASFTPLHTYHAGERRSRGRVNSSSGFNVDVSDASWDGLDAQAEDAEAFLRDHAASLRRLTLFPGVTACLDFPLELRIGKGSVIQSDRFPATLAKLAGDLGIELEFTIYPCDDDSPSGPK